MTEQKLDSDRCPLPSVRTFDGHDWFSTKTFRRNLPHWELKGSTYFITVCVEKNLLKPFLDHNLANYMIETLNRFDKIDYELQAFVIMPDHLHLILKPFWNKSLSEVMKKLKGSSSFHINKQLNRNGKFWQGENFDHLIRNTLDLQEKWEYIKQNPVKAKLVDQAEQYPYSSFYERITG